MNEDTLHLLSECASGTDMAIRSLEDVLKNSAEGPLQKRLLDSKRQHEQLAAQAEDRLRRQGKVPKRADPAARAMSYLKTQAMLSMKPGDATTADLISTGCSMGIKSLARYCNQYPQRTRTRGASLSRSSGWRTSWSRICGRICNRTLGRAIAAHKIFICQPADFGV